MRSTKVTYTLVAADADGICASQTPLGAGALTIDGVLASSGVVTLSDPQRLSVSCAGADAAKNFTITGTDYRGIPLSEVIAGSNGSITNGTKSFKTITSVVVSAATANAVTVGVLGAGEMPWVPMDVVTPFAYHVDVGTATFTVEGTLDSVQSTSDAVPDGHITIQASGGSDVGAVSTAPVRAIRVKVTAFTSGDIIFRVLQP